MTSVETPVNVPNDSALDQPPIREGNDETERAAAMVFASPEPNVLLRGLVLATLLSLAVLLLFLVQFLDRQANPTTSAAASEDIAAGEEMNVEDLENTRDTDVAVAPTSAAEPTATTAAPTATAATEPSATAPRNDGLELDSKSIDKLLDAEPITFEPNSFEIDSASQAYLAEAAELIAANADLRVEVAGFADSLGGDGWNRELSQTRATTVRQHLIDAGVPASRLVAQGYGRNEPVASNDTADGRNANRRVELRLIRTT